MAFLCPSRKGRETKEGKTKVKSSAVFGRITGSDSVDTLVKVGLEKQHGLPADSKLLVLRDFIPVSDDELPVSRGQEVYLLYKENEWCYVINAYGQEGFVPESFCTHVKKKIKNSGEKLASQRNPWSLNQSNAINDSLESADSAFTDGAMSAFSDRDSAMADYMTNPITPEIRPFRKASHGQYIALFDFKGVDENDASVERAELFEVLNIEDPDWSWIRKYNNHEGFVPKSFICPVEPLILQVHESSKHSKPYHQSSTTPCIRQTLLSRDTPTRFHQSTPQPNTKLPIRPTILEVSNCYKDSNVSDTKKEISTIHDHDSSNITKNDKHSTLRSRSPATLDRTHLKVKSKPVDMARSLSPATSDRLKLRVSSVPTNEIHRSRSSTPSSAINVKMESDIGINSGSLNSMLPSLGVNETKCRFDSSSLSRLSANLDSPTSFSPVFSSSRRPSFAKPNDQSESPEIKEKCNRDSNSIFDKHDVNIGNNYTENRNDGFRLGKTSIDNYQFGGNNNNPYQTRKTHDDNQLGDHSNVNYQSGERNGAECCQSEGNNFSQTDHFGNTQNRIKYDYQLNEPGEYQYPQPQMDGHENHISHLRLDKIGPRDNEKSTTKPSSPPPYEYAMARSRQPIYTPSQLRNSLTMAENERIHIGDSHIQAKQGHLHDRLQTDNLSFQTDNDDLRVSNSRSRTDNSIPPANISYLNSDIVESTSENYNLHSEYLHQLSNKTVHSKSQSTSSSSVSNTLTHTHARHHSTGDITSRIRIATSLPTSRCTSPRLELVQPRKEHEKVVRSAVHSNLTSEEYRQFSKKQFAKTPLPDTSSHSDIQSQYLGKSSSVGNLVAKFNAVADIKIQNNPLVSFTKTVSQSKSSENISKPSNQSENLNNFTTASRDSVQTLPSTTRNIDYSTLSVKTDDVRSSTPVTNTAGENVSSELVMLYDFSSQTADGLAIRRGEVVFVDGPEQLDPHWLWVFYPSGQKYGYVPKNYVKSTMLKTTL